MGDCQEVSFGTVDMNESLSSCIDGQDSQEGASMSDKAASMGEMLSEINHKADTSDVSFFLG